eukprot:gene10240-11334_t
MMTTMDSPTTGGSHDARLLELQTLQREYRRMEIDRRAYAEQSQAILRKQQLTIDKFKHDNDQLKHDIAMIMRASNRPMTSNEQETVQAITDLGEKYATMIDYESQNIQTMEEQIMILKQKSLQQRRVMGGVNASKENYQMIQKQIKILENRLDKSLVKFNEAVSHNKKLREEIDDLRRERVVFENIYRKMERELQERKKAMAQIIEQSNQAYEQRDAFQMEVAAIEQANRKEQEDFDEQMATLAHLLETELQLPAIGASLGVKAKSLTKLSKSQLLLSPIRGPAGGGGGSDGMRMSKSAGSLYDSTIMDGTSSVHSGTEAGGGSGNGVGGGSKEIDYKERVQNFEEAFNKIKAATGISDINNLVQIFIKNEEHNFSLFNYVNEQNNEIEKLEEAILLLKEEENKYKVENGQDVSQHKEILKDLENKLQYTDTMAEKYELKCQELTRIIETLKRGMQSIVMKVEVYHHDQGDNQTSNTMMSTTATSSPTSPKPLSPSQDNNNNTTLTQGNNNNATATTTTSGYTPPTITEINMVNYLGILENKAIQLLQQYTNLRNLMIAPHPDLADFLKTGGTTATGGLDNSLTSPTTPGILGMSGNLVSVLGTGPKVPMGTDHIHINPPKADDYRSDEEEEEGPPGSALFDEDEARPFTREELKFKTLSKLQKKLGVTLANVSNTINLPLSNGGDSLKKKSSKK